MRKKKFLHGILIFVFVFTGCFISSPAAQKDTLLHFVQISDTHLQRDIAGDGERLLGSSEKLLTTLVNQINEIKNLDFVLATGDLVDQPLTNTVDKFIDITMSLNYPFYVTLGNHDVSISGGLGKKGFIKKFYESDNAVSFTNEMTYYSFSPNDQFTFLCLDGTTDKEVSSNGYFDEDQFEWLTEQLEENKDKYVIIALHFPFVEPFKSPSHKFSSQWHTRIMNLLKEHKNIIGVFTGHYHTARLIKTKNKIHNSNPAIIQYPCAFREITITQDNPKYLNIDFKWHVVKEPDLVEVSKQNSKAWSVAGGAPEDREQIIKWKIFK